MSAASDYLENKLGDHVLRNTAYTVPSTVYVALFTAAPSDSGGGTEVSGGSYARVQHGPSTSTWYGTHGTTTGASSGTDGAFENAGTITFAAPTANWGTVTHFGLFDASTSGNLLCWGALTASRVINSGDAAPSFADAALVVTFA